MAKRQHIRTKPVRGARKKKKPPRKSKGSKEPRSFGGRLLSEVRVAWKACPATHANLRAACAQHPERPLVIRLRTQFDEGDVYVVYEMLPEGRDFRFKRREDLDVSAD